MDENLLDAVAEIKGTEDISYVIKQDETFFLTGYKIMQSKESRGLVECAKLRFNGKIKLVYFTSGYMSLQAIMNYLDITAVKTVLRNLIANILIIKNNGFLKCENIDTAPEKIFVDKNTLEVYLIYLPIKVEENIYDRNIFENNLRTQLIKLLNSNMNLSGSDMKTVLFELSNGSASLEHVYQVLQQSGTYDVVQQKGDNNPCTLKLESQDRNIHFEIDKDEFVIGKNAGMVDGVISGNPAISRTHCKIIRKNQQYFIVDLRSSNGTYVNGHRLASQEECVIETGAKVRIANEIFVVK